MQQVVPVPASRRRRLSLAGGDPVGTDSGWRTVTAVAHSSCLPPVLSGQHAISDGADCPDGWEPGADEIVVPDRGAVRVYVRRAGGYQRSDAVVGIPGNQSSAGW